MLRNAARLHAMCCTTASARVARVRPLRHSIPTLLVPTSCFEAKRHDPSQCPNGVVPFSSAPRMQGKELENDGVIGHPARFVDAAAHAKPKAQRDERRQTHEGLAKTSPKKKDHNRRRILAEELMRIFAASDECFNATLRELNINKTWGKDSGLSEYRQFYLDSLNSFGTILSDDHRDKEVLSPIGLSSESVTSMLEQFANVVSPNDPRELTKKYLEMARLTSKPKSAGNSFEQSGRERKKQLRQVRVEEHFLGMTESEQARERDERISSSNEKDLSARKLLPLLTTRSYANELDKIEKELSKALSQGEKLPESYPERAEVNSRRIKVIQDKTVPERKSKLVSVIESKTMVEGPMTDHEFTSIPENILRIKPSVASALAKYIVDRHDDFDKYRQLEMKTDLTKPHEWYPRARLDKRKIIFHAGPTNSGKTYHALQRLKRVKKGMYLAPLRLLAAETYESLTAEGIYTNLLTGQEKQNIPFSTHQSSTIELACLEEDYDVVVIDEIQMLRDEVRGFAWTRALLGVRCKEIHVCGGAEAVDIVKKMCRMCGDDFELHGYKRFSDLKVLENSLAKSSDSKGSYAHVQPGDCVVAFSRHDIFAIKREIENTTPYKCCVIYGSLPPGVRAEQARRFNDPTSRYEILVASDAIGMGLNLSIKRIVFNSMLKYNGHRIVQLDHSSVKQIAGRAGRRNSPYPNGEVTCRDPNDMAHLRECMDNEIPPLKKAGLIPTPSHIAVFNQHLEEYGLSSKKMELHQTLGKFSEMATLKGDFFLCRQKEMGIVSHWLKGVANLSTEQKFTLCMSPVNENCSKSKSVLMRYVETYFSGKVPGVHFTMRPRPAKSMEHLADLCSVHHQLELFIWLQNKLPSNAVEVLRALSLKERTIEMINTGLLNAEKLSLQHDYIAKDMRVKKQWEDERRHRDDSRYVV